MPSKSTYMKFLLDSSHHLCNLSRLDLEPVSLPSAIGNLKCDISQKWSLEIFPSFLRAKSQPPTFLAWPAKYTVLVSRATSLNVRGRKVSGRFGRTPPQSIVGCCVPRTCGVPSVCTTKSRLFGVSMARDGRLLTWKTGFYLVYFCVWSVKVFWAG